MVICMNTLVWWNRSVLLKDRGTETLKIEIPYGKTKQTLEISEDRVRAVISPRKPEAESWQRIRKKSW